jgi:hypothetical protein
LQVMYALQLLHLLQNLQVGVVEWRQHSCPHSFTFPPQDSAPYFWTRMESKASLCGQPIIAAPNTREKGEKRECKNPNEEEENSNAQSSCKRESYKSHSTIP